MIEINHIPFDVPIAGFFFEQKTTAWHPMLQWNSGNLNGAILINDFAGSRIELLEYNLKRTTIGKIPEMRYQQGFQIGVSVYGQIGSAIEHSESGYESHQPENMIAMQV